ncbi:MAG: phosphoribosyltransferase [Phyllobacterium sp.]
MFEDRADAGRQLAKAMDYYRQDSNVLLLALPRGGVLVAAEIARELGLAMALLWVRKIGVPRHIELAMGAVMGQTPPIVVRNDDIIGMYGITENDFQKALQRELEEISHRQERYGQAAGQAEIAGRIAIIVDDGIATGATALSAVRGVRACGPQKIVLAVPVASRESLREIAHDVDDIVCIENAMAMGAIGFYYGDFHQVTEDEFMECMKLSGLRDS